MARERLGNGETLRLHLKISEEEVAAVDDWRFANRAESRSDAIRRLLQMGLLIDSIRPDLLSNVRDGAILAEEFDAALHQWAVSKGEEFNVRQHLLFDDETATGFREAYGKLLKDGDDRVVMITTLIERLAEISKADADLGAIVKDIARVRSFYAERAAEIAGERPKNSKDEEGGK